MTRKYVHPLEASFGIMAFPFAHKLRSVLSSIVSPPPGVNDRGREGAPLEAWQAPILQAVLVAFVVLAGIAYFPRVWVAARTDSWGIVIGDTAIYLLGLALLRARRLPYRLRATLALTLQYLLGAFLLLAAGPSGAGRAWLFAFSILTAVFLGRRATIVAVLLNTVTILGVGAVAGMGLLAWSGGADTERGLWIVLAGNYLLLGWIVTLAVSVIIQRLEEALESNRRTRLQLEGERSRLVSSNAQLQRALEEQRRAESERGRLATVVEQASLPIVVTDPQGRAEYVNAAFSELSGYAADEIVGRPLAETGCLGERIEVDEALEAALTHRTWRGRRTARRRGGKPYEVDVTLYSLRDEAWNVTNIVATLRDVTRERVLETQLQQSQKMEALGTLAGGIAHDFNNLLVPIIANVQLARMDVPQGEDVHTFLGDALEAADRARSLVRQILTFSRRTEREREPVPLAKALDQFQSLVRAALPPGIRVHRVDELDDAVVFADPVELHQVLVNLSANAGYAMRDSGGVLTVRVDGQPPTGEADWSRPGEGPAAPHGWVHLTVADTGHGMDRRTLNRIFEPFFTTKPPGQGTGLGLAVVHGIVRSLDGELHVDSEPGKGTAVHVWLPRAPAVEATEEHAQLRPPRGSGEHVLLVDDDIPVLVATGRVLCRLGYKVTECRDGTEALARYHEDPKSFDIVLSDLAMPGLTGLQLAEAVERTGAGTPVVLATGYLDGLGRVGAEAAGVAGVLAKPFEVRVLAEMLRRALDEVVQSAA